MTFFQVILLSFVQGLTEFLPVSSSGHLVIVPELLHFTTQPTILFDLTLHLGTLAAVVLFLWKDILQIIHGLIQKKTEYWFIVFKIALAIVPAAIVGFLFDDFIDILFFQNVLFVGYAYFGTALVLFLTFFLKDKGKTMFTVTWWDVLVIGLMQACALVPGFSRSGFTLVGALLVGMKRKEAFKFSFLISIPAILGAFIFKLPDIQLEAFPVSFILGFFVSMIVGFFSLFLLKNLLKKQRLYWFSIYCLFIAILTIVKFQ